MTTPAGATQTDPSDVAWFRARRVAVTDEIARACDRAGRDPARVTLVAVSKTVPAERLVAAVAAGLGILGENRVQEAAAKAPLVPGATWHLIGPLQSNKARRAAELFATIETVDSVALAERLDRLVRELRGEPAVDRQAAEQPAAERPPPAGPSAVPLAEEARLPVLLQVNVDLDATKAGFAPGAVAAAAEQIVGLGALRVDGLMTIGRLAGDPEEARATFRGLRELSETVRATVSGLGPALSMGMSDDYPAAVEEGATLVRVGRAIFGERPIAGA